MAGLTDLGAARVAEFDRSDMLGAIAGLPRQLTAGYAVARSGLSGVFGEAGAAAPAAPARPTGLVVCGMGGSAIGADLVLACLPGLPVPAAVVTLILPVVAVVGTVAAIWVGELTV